MSGEVETRRRLMNWEPGGTGSALTVRVTPRASKTDLTGLLPDGTLKVRVAAAPVEGAANEALIGFLSRVLDVRESTIEILAGAKGRDKILAVAGLPAPEVETRIQTWLQRKKRAGRSKEDAS